ncbi:MAG: hypothetical protein GX872_02025 [Firmicutes bacterium]|nr:hypothetical protein [Bacillota bacterium]
MKQRLPGIKGITVIKACVFLAVICCVFGVPVFADTGTFKIRNYTVEITPQPDGSWVADYRQEWEVLSGTAPWVTVGLPNADYKITSWSGAATKVRSDNQGAWSGVFVQLDRDYGKGESFDFGFTVTQHKVAYPKDDSHVEFSFTPGWYDDITVERMVIILQNPWSQEDLKFISPTPYEKTGDRAVWVSKLGPGQRFKVNFAFSSEVFTELEQSPKGRPANNGAPPIVGFCVLFIVIVMFLMILNAILRSRRRYYRGRRGIYYGTPRPFGTPVIVKTGSNEGKQPGKTGDASGSGNSKKSGSGGGGFGGRAGGCHCVSCACACVSCACACACAGGRGAGCTRKFSRIDKSVKEDDAKRADMAWS